MTRAEHIHNVYQRSAHPFNDLWAWAVEPQKLRERFLRFRALEDWARRKRDNDRDGDTWHTWNERRLAYRHRKLRIWRKLHPPAPTTPWPASVHITELFNNDNALHNHLHVASTDRNALIALAKIAVAHYGGAGLVREFPPFDPVECVHVDGSWHYRWSSSPFTPRNCAERGDGLAMDLGFALRQEFGDEVKRRYGADRSDF